jgi:hypothetical protein
MQLTKIHGGNILKVNHKHWPVNRSLLSQVGYFYLNANFTEFLTFYIFYSLCSTPSLLYTEIHINKHFGSVKLDLHI